MNSSARPHVMHLVHDLIPGGLERLAVELANQRASAGHQTSMCVSGDRTDIAETLSAAVPVHLLRRSWRFDPAAARRLAAVVRADGIDLLHLHNLGMLIFVSYVRATTRLRTPLVFHDHDCGPNHQRRAPLWFRLWGRHVLSMYVGVYDGAMTWALHSGVPSAQARMIGNSIDPVPFAESLPCPIRQQFGIPENRVVGVVVSRLHEQKGVDLLLRAVATCRCREHLSLVIVGGDSDKGYANFCRRLRRNLGLEGVVHFLGTRTDVPGVLKGADFGVLASRYESGPLVLLEYLASGLPFVASSTGNVAERLAAVGVGDFVPPGDVDALAAGLDRMACLSREERHRVGAEGQAVVARNFDIRASMPVWERVYDEAIAGGRPPGGAAD